jgi:hypothetical protein
VSELADIFRQAGPAYRERFGDRMLPSHLHAMWDIEHCRTPALGGHVLECDHCHRQDYAYHSCRNRHCPTCQTDRARRWLETQRQLLLPCPYWLATVTLPAQLRSLARSHQRTVYDLLIREAATALLDLAADPKWIGGRTAVLAVLHTWTRAMVYHPHVHLLFPAGGLSPDGTAWVKPKSRKYLLPDYVLADRFRTRMRRALEKAGLLQLVPREVSTIRWVADVSPVGSGDNALRYISRYLLRVAISNHRIERFDDGRVTFRWTDFQTRTIRRSTLDVDAFIARFLQHVLPSGFVKVRTYGLWASTCRPSLEAARSTLSNHPAVTPAARGRTEGSEERPASAHGEARLCPCCAIGHLRPIAVIPRMRAPP